MSSIPTRRALLCANDSKRLEAVRAILRDEGWNTSDGDLAATANDVESFSLIVVDGLDADRAVVAELCRQTRDGLGNRFVPVVVVGEPPLAAARRHSFEIGADGFVAAPVDAQDLLDVSGRLQRIKVMYDRLWEESTASQRAGRRLEIAYRQIDQELDLAGKIQSGLLPRELPHLRSIRFTVKYEKAAQVCGDFYDVVNLDERTLGFYVADVMGHGIPAGLLTIYLKKAVVMKEPSNDGHRILTPGEVLARVNGDLVAQQLSENPFITMAYLLLDVETLGLRYARAGHPYPLRIGVGAKVEELKSDGTLLGIFDTDFDEGSTRLAPGDKVLVYTDGVDEVRYGTHQQGTKSFLACVEDHGSLPIEELIDNVYQSLFGDAGHDDDLTIFGLEIGA